LASHKDAGGDTDGILGRHSPQSLIYHEFALEVRFVRGAAGPSGSDEFFDHIWNRVYGELLFRQATWHATLLHPFFYVIDSKRAPNCGKAQCLLRARFTIEVVMVPPNAKALLNVSSPQTSSTLPTPPHAQSCS
jgi:hypothetical protein